MKIGLLSLIVIFLSLPVHAASEYVRRLQESYDKLASIEASFEQVYRSKRFGEKVNKGKVVIAKPGLMRWDYDEPKGKVLVSNGKTIILYDPEDQQALISPKPKKGGMPIALSFLWGEGDLNESFSCAQTKEKTSSDKVVTLRCDPRQPIPNVVELHLTITKDEPILVTSTRVVDALGGENELRFTNINTAPTISAKHFKFTPPPDTNFVSMDNGEVERP